MAVFCFMMVSNIQYDKMPRFSFRDNRANHIKLTILLVSLTLIIISPGTFFFPLCLVYISHGIIRSLVAHWLKLVQRTGE